MRRVDANGDFCPENCLSRDKKKEYQIKITINDVYDANEITYNTTIVLRARVYGTDNELESESGRYECAGFNEII